MPERWLAPLHPGNRSSPLSSKRQGLTAAHAESRHGQISLQTQMGLRRPASPHPALTYSVSILRAGNRRGQEGGSGPKNLFECSMSVISRGAAAAAAGAAASGHHAPGRGPEMRLLWVARCMSAKGPFGQRSAGGSAVSWFQATMIEVSEVQLVSHSLGREPLHSVGQAGQARGRRVRSAACLLVKALLLPLGPAARQNRGWSCVR